MVALVKAEMFHKEYAEVFSGDADWRKLPIPEGLTYQWQPDSTYIRRPSFFDRLEATTDYHGFSRARVLALLGDSITTDHISPAGAFQADSPAGRYLIEQGVAERDFNSYGSRRGNHQLMKRGTFANIRLRNKMLPGVEGGFTKLQPDGEQMSIYSAAEAYASKQVPLLIIAGKEYGTGSSRDWAAKGTKLLGVKAVLAESYERIHRSNLVGMGVLPLQFLTGDSAAALQLDGSEQFSLKHSGALRPKKGLTLQIERADGRCETVAVTCRLDTDEEVAYFQSGGILNLVLLKLMAD